MIESPPVVLRGTGARTFRAGVDQGIGRLAKAVAGKAVDSRLGPLAGRMIGRPFPRRAGRRVLFLYEARRISYTQIYPFTQYADAIADRYGAVMSFVPNTRLDVGVSAALRRADTIVLQSWLTDPSDRLPRLLEQVHAQVGDARLVYFDSFANSDIRFSTILEPHVAAYAKKSLFRDRRRALTPTRGDTELIEFYNRLCGIAPEPLSAPPPEAILDRLHLAPNFFTSPNLMARFLAARPFRPSAERSIDVHARLVSKGTPFYEAMRGSALESLSALSGRRVMTETGIRWSRYMAELGDAKLCFSPFGYGEICWRDVEAILQGAVVIKPDMSHLDTLPDLYVPWETYVPVAWSHEDVAATVERLLRDPGLCDRIAAAAFERVRRYLAEGRFVDDMDFVFA